MVFWMNKKINLILLLSFALVLSSFSVSAVFWNGTETLFHDHMTSFDNYTVGYHTATSSLTLDGGTWFRAPSSTYLGNSINLSNASNYFEPFTLPKEWKVTAHLKKGSVNFHHFFGWTEGAPDPTQDIHLTMDNGRIFFQYNGANIYYTGSAVTTNTTGTFTWWYNKTGDNHMVCYYGDTRLNGTVDNAVHVPALNITNFGLKTVKTDNAYNWINFTNMRYVPPVPPQTSNIDLLFSGEDNRTDYKTLFDEGEDFNIFINYTNEFNNPINNINGSCNITVVNGIFENKTNELNYSICRSGCDYKYHTQNFKIESNISVSTDYIKIEACHENLPLGQSNITIQ